MVGFIVDIAHQLCPQNEGTAKLDFGRFYGHVVLKEEDRTWISEMMCYDGRVSLLRSRTLVTQ